MEENEYIDGLKAQTEYAGEYTYYGRKWCLNFFAVDDADALVRLQNIKDTLVILGPIACTIPYTP